jgi:hypothetical protein
MTEEPAKGEIVALRDDSNNASEDEIPPVRQHEMVESSPRAMSHLILAQKTRILACPGWSESRIQRISTDHCNLSASYPKAALLNVTSIAAIIPLCSMLPGAFQASRKRILM